MTYFSPLHTNPGALSDFDKPAVPSAKKAASKSETSEEKETSNEATDQKRSSTTTNSTDSSSTSTSADALPSEDELSKIFVASFADAAADLENAMKKMGGDYDQDFVSHLNKLAESAKTAAVQGILQRLQLFYLHEEVACMHAYQLFFNQEPVVQSLDEFIHWITLSKSIVFVWVLSAAYLLSLCTTGPRIFLVHIQEFRKTFSKMNIMFSLPFISWLWILLFIEHPEAMGAFEDNLAKTLNDMAQNTKDLEVLSMHQNILISVVFCLKGLKQFTRCIQASNTPKKIV